MHLASYKIRGRDSFGVVVGDGIVDLKPRMSARYSSVLDILRAGALNEAKSTAAGVRPDFPLSEAEMTIPVPGGEKILCIGVNYANRDTELTQAGGYQEAKYPSMFFKPPNSFVGHNGVILRPPESEQLEYEGEICLVIGKTGRRIPYLFACMVAAVPGLVGLAFATSYPMLLASSFLLGVATLSAGPIGFEYGAEVSHPAPESTTQGLLMMGGQLSGAIFIFAMDAVHARTGSMSAFMIFFIVATALNAVLATRLREAPATGEE